jgi:hypothetical protein
MSDPHLLTSFGDELLDHPDADPTTVARSLHHIARSNFWFGGWWAVRHGLHRLLAEVPRGTTLTLLDVGTGNGDLPARAVAWARTRGITLKPIGIERHRTAALLASRRGMATLLGCAGALPVRPRSVDLVLASQLAHHLSPRANIEFFQAAQQAARLGVVIADLRRSPLALAGFWFGSRIFRFDRATREDGLTSVMRGFHPGELAALLQQAGIAARVERSAGFRLVASWSV